MDPMTIAMIAMAAAKGLKGLMAWIGGKSAQKGAKLAADQARREAQVGADIALLEGDRVSASAAVAAASSGGGLTGSTFDVLEDLGRQASHNARTSIYEGDTKAKRFEYEGRVKRSEGQAALISAVVDAGASFLGSSGQQAQGASLEGASAGTRLPQSKPSGGAGMQDRY